MTAQLSRTTLGGFGQGAAAQLGHHVPARHRDRRGDRRVAVTERRPTWATPQHGLLHGAEDRAVRLG